MLKLELIANTPVVKEPFPYFAISGVLAPSTLREISRDFPSTPGTGIFPLSELQVEGAFARLIEEINGPALETLLAAKFNLPLSDLPLMITVRGMCQRHDGRIHTDSTDKVLTCLLYLNDPTWSAEGGRLRLLRDGHDLNSTIAEVPPIGGNLVAFVRTENSWHGHGPFEGPRRYVMFNWLRSNVALAKNLGRHKLSAAFKRLGNLHGA